MDICQVVVGDWSPECSKGITREERERLVPQKKNDMLFFSFCFLMMFLFLIDLFLFYILFFGMVFVVSIPFLFFNFLKIIISVCS